MDLSDEFNLVEPESSSHDLNCSVCLSYFEEPRLLPCGHSFCWNCLIPLIDKRCPLCRITFGSVKNLEKNVVLADFISKFKNKVPSSLLQQVCFPQQQTSPFLFQLNVHSTKKKTKTK